MLVAGPLQGFGKVLFFVISAVLDNLVRQDLVYLHLIYSIHRGWRTFERGCSAPDRSRT